jgi:hypothetical protein
LSFSPYTQEKYLFTCHQAVVLTLFPITYSWQSKILVQLLVLFRRMNKAKYFVWSSMRRMSLLIW